MSWPPAIKFLALEDEDNRALLKNILCIVPELTMLRSTTGSSALHYCVLEEKPESLTLLLSFGCDINSRNYYEETPLHWAAKSGKEKTCRILLDSGADINAEDFDGNTPLHWACECGNTEIIKMFLECKNIHVEKENCNNFTPLEVAVENGDRRSIHIFLEKKFVNYSRRQLLECAKFSEDQLTIELVNNLYIHYLQKNPSVFR